MPLDFTRYQKAREEGATLYLPTFILKKGESAKIRLNPHPDISEPFMVDAHWIGEGTQSRKIYCALNDPRYKGACPACQLGMRTATSVGFNIIDTRWQHRIQDGNKWVYEPCPDKTKGKAGNCPHCRKKLEAKMCGARVWELSPKPVSLLQDFVEEQESRCVCGLDLEPVGWDCPECNTAFEGELPETEKVKCPECKALIHPALAYDCECGDPRPRKITDMYFLVKRARTGDYSFHFRDNWYVPLEEQHKLEPLDLAAVMIPKPPHEFLRTLGVAPERAQAFLQGLQQQKQLTDGKDGDDGYIEGEVVGDDEDDDFEA